MNMKELSERGRGRRSFAPFSANLVKNKNWRIHYEYAGASRAGGGRRSLAPPSLVGFSLNDDNDEKLVRS